MQDKSITCNEPQCYLRASGKHKALLCKCRYAAGLHNKAEMVGEVVKWKPKPCFPGQPLPLDSVETQCGAEQQRCLRGLGFLWEM